MVTAALRARSALNDATTTGALRTAGRAASGGRRSDTVCGLGRQPAGETAPGRRPACGRQVAGSAPAPSSDIELQV